MYRAITIKQKFQVNLRNYKITVVGIIRYNILLTNVRNKTLCFACILLRSFHWHKTILFKRYRLFSSRSSSRPNNSINTGRFPDLILNHDTPTRILYRSLRNFHERPDWHVTIHTYIFRSSSIDSCLHWWRVISG